MKRRNKILGLYIVKSILHPSNSHPQLALLPNPFSHTHNPIFDFLLLLSPTISTARLSFRHWEALRLGLSFISSHHCPVSVLSHGITLPCQGLYYLFLLI